MSPKIKIELTDVKILMGCLRTYIDMNFFCLGLLWGIQSCSSSRHVKCVDVAGIKEIPAKFHGGLSMKAVHKHCQIKLTSKKKKCSL